MLPQSQALEERDQDVERESHEGFIRRKGAAYNHCRGEIAGNRSVTRPVRAHILRK